MNRRSSVSSKINNKKPRRIIAIMAGGRGERFWPQSRSTRPKHLLPIVGTQTMLNQTIDRLSGLVPHSDILVITNAAQEQAVREVCVTIPPRNIIIEPLGRDTAPAALLASLVAKRISKGATIALLPADHVIKDIGGFEATLEAAFSAAESGDYLVTVAIPPTHPETGFGYIERGDIHAKIDNQEVYKVKRFVEKPSIDKAQEYLGAGTFYWNGGMFVWSVASIEKALKKHARELHGCFTRLERDLEKNASFKYVVLKHYETLPKISIDYAVMEKAQNVLTVPAAFDWDDVGSWTALIRHFPHDEHGNVVCGNAIVEAGKNNIILSTEGHITAVLGVEGLVVVHTDDATLVCPADKAQEIKRLLRRIENHPKGKGVL